MAVWLAGGGSPRQEAQVWERAFDGVQRVTYWPFALPHERVAEAPAWLRAGLAELQIEARVDTWPALEGRTPGELTDTELLFVGGGTRSRLLRHLHEQDFIEPVRDFVRSGGRYYGGSAGALLACDSIAIAAPCDGDDEARTARPALGLVDGLTVLPHADTFAAEQVRRWATRFGPLLALPEASGAEITDGQLRALGPDSPWIQYPDGRTSAVPDAATGRDLDGKE